MTNYKTMTEQIEKMHSITGNTTTVASALKRVVDEGVAKIRADRNLTTDGQREAITALRKKHGKEFVAQAKAMRAEYDGAVLAAKTSAELVINAQAEKPSDASIATFQRQLTDFKTELLLASNVDSAFKMAQSFVSAQNEPYFAQQLKAEIPTIVGDVLSLAGTEAPTYKAKLRQTVDTLNGVAFTPEQQEAKAVYESVGSQHGKDIFFKEGVQLTAIRNAVGNDFSKFANDPSGYIEKDDE